ncbi:ComF family protein [Brevibacillus choshinensis]|uniref:ComF family protein n=1 Tax=Brevibacillus choshinensis TaxID=54911 RepID=A0ABX7FNQ5_BRECH|nr:ComF family protein [Brevibacillus choshinensis]QRG67325.1 ComF family protein [Brevibacillus choshinensis]
MSRSICVACAGRIVLQSREASVRRLTNQLSSNRTRYPAMYRLISGLSLCASCLEKLPVIGAAICWQCGREQETEELCQDCHKLTEETLQSNRSLLRYNQWGKDLLSMYKYRGEERLAVLYAKLLAIAVLRYHQVTSFDCIAPVPLHDQRLQERGFNQVDLLAGRLGAEMGVPVRALLHRTKRTAKLSQQTGRSAREESMDGAFSWAGERLGQAKAGSYRILLLDDIYTTGSTLRSCARTIREHAGSLCDIYSVTIYR